MAGPIVERGADGSSVAFVDGNTGAPGTMRNQQSLTIKEADGTTENIIVTQGQSAMIAIEKKDRNGNILVDEVIERTADNTTSFDLLRNQVIAAGRGLNNNGTLDSSELSTSQNAYRAAETFTKQNTR